MTRSSKYFEKVIASSIAFLLLCLPAFPLVTWDPVGQAGGDGSGNYPAPDEGDWIITNETVVRNETIVLNGNLTIKAGGNLTLLNGSIVFDCTRDGEFGVTVESGGELHALGRKEVIEGARSIDYDLITGRDSDGIIYLFENSGTLEIPNWEDRVTLKDVNGDDVDVGNNDDFSVPALADLDNDNDLDLTIGEEDGDLNYYENTGTMKIPEWTEDSSMFSGINVGGRSVPEFADLDGDGDLDLALGNGDGNTYYFENTGTASEPEWTQDNSMFSVVGDVGYNAAPAFADLDNDGDFDLAIGEYAGNFNYYENTGTADAPEWTEDNSMFSGMSVGGNQRSCPAFVDIDGDGPGVVSGETIWHSEFNTTGQYTFDFVVEDGAVFEMNLTKVIKCGSGDAGHYGLTVEADDVTITDSMFEWNHMGIYLDGVSGALVRDNTFENNSVGVYINGGSDNSIINNSIAYNDRGILLSASGDDSIRDNRFVVCSVLIEGTEVDDFASHTIHNNTVNNAPLYYYSNTDGVTVPANASAVILANCTDMTVEGLDLSAADAGIELAYVDDSLVSDNNINACDYGIYIYASDGNTFRYNTIGDGNVGMLFKGSSTGNSIHFNSISGNDVSGVDASQNGGTVVDAVKNFWGDSSGPYHPADNTVGKGNSITDDVLFEPWLRAPHGENVWYVDAGVPGGGNGSAGNPFNMIQDALDMASRDENVFVLPGTYSEKLEVSRSMNIFGINGDVELDAGGGTGVTIKGGAAGTTITNISITNGATDLDLAAATTLCNVSFSDSKLNFVGNPVLSVGYYLDVTLINVYDDPVPAAALAISDNGTWNAMYYSNDEGVVDDIVVIEYRRDSWGTTELNPFSLHAYGDPGYSRVSIEIHSDTRIVLSLTRHGAFGTSVACGDLDGDGIDDYVVGAPLDSQSAEKTGSVFVFYGPRNGVKVLKPIDADLLIEGDRNGSRLGSTLRIADIDNDELPELIAGAPGYNRAIPGITGEYYNNDDFTNLEFTRIDDNINFPWGNGDPGGLGQSFSVRWTGHLLVETGDDYTFYADIDDGMWLHIDGTTVITRESYDSAEASSGPVHLEPGFHDIAIDFRDTGGGARALLKWESTNLTKEIIPPEYFFSGIDTGLPDGAVFVFPGQLFAGQPGGSLEINDAVILTGDEAGIEGLSTTLTTGDIDSDDYPDILAGNELGVTVFYGEEDMSSSLQQSTFYGLDQPAMVNFDGVESMAAVVDGEVKLYSMGPDDFLLDSNVGRADFKGSFNQTRFVNGLTITPYPAIVPNGDFDYGWDNWTRNTTIRDKNDGTWEITETEHGDWKVYDGPTAGLGPDSDNVAHDDNQGEDCDGKLVSEPFLVPEDVTTFEFWHHAEWWSFERASESGYQDDKDDLISMRLVNDTSGSTVAEKKYGRDYGGTTGEEEGRLQFNISAYRGEWLRFEMELSNNRPQSEDGIIQIDNLVAITENPYQEGDFTSDLIDFGMTIKSFIPRWNEELNGGNITLYARTNASGAWSIMTYDELMKFPGNEDTTFQYKVVLEGVPGEPYPILEELHFNFFNFTPESRGEGIPYNVGPVFDNDTLAIVNSSTATLFDTTSGSRDGAHSFPAVNITSDNDMDALTPIEDVDANGIPDMLISSGNTAYYVLMDDTGDDIVLEDMTYSFTGPEGYGLALSRNLVGSPQEHYDDGRAYILPMYMEDGVILGTDVEDHTLFYPGSDISLNLSIINKGLLDMASLVITMNITGEDGYSNETTTDISIDSWEFGEAMFDWHVPAGEGINYTVRFFLPPDNDNSSNFFSIDLRARYHDFALLTEKDYDAVRTDGILHYLIEVDNIGTFGPDDISFDVTVPVNWDWWAREEGMGGDGGTNITHIVVDDMEIIELFVLANSTPGDYPISILATSENGVTTAELDLMAYIVEKDIEVLAIRFFREDGTEATNVTHIVGREDSRIEIDLRNIGTLAVGAFDVRLSRDGDDEDVSIDCEGLAVDEAITLVKKWEFFTGGYYNVTVEADMDDVLYEYDEDNNILTEQIYVMPGTPENSFILNITAVDKDGEVLEDLTVEVDNVDSSFHDEVQTDYNGFVKVVVEAPYDYDEGDEIFIEISEGEEYGAARLLIYSEDGSAEVFIVVAFYSVELDTEKHFESILPAEHPEYRSARFPITVTNTGEANDTYTLSAEALSDDWDDWNYWDAIFEGDNVTYDQDDEEYLIPVPTGESQDVVLVVNSAAGDFSYYHTQAGDYGIVVRAVSVISDLAFSIVELEVVVPQFGGVSLGHSTFPDVNVERGTIYDFVFYVDNSGNIERQIDLFIGGPDASWGRFKYDETHVTRDAGDNVTTTLHVEVPHDAPAYYNASLWIYGVDSVSGQTNSLYYNITVFSDSMISLEYSPIDHDNEYFNYSITLRNEGEKVMDALLDVEFAGGDALADVASITLGINETVTFHLSLKLTDMIPSAGSKSRIVHIYLDWAEGVEDIFFHPVLPRVSNLEMSVPSGEETSKSAFPGETLIFSAELSNYGNAREGLNFFFTGTNAAWFLPPDPIQLGRYSLEKVWFDCLVPANASGSDRAEVSFYAVSDSGIVYGSLPYSVELQDDSRQLEFRIPPALHSSGTDGTVWIVKLYNKGMVPETVILEADFPAGWDVSLDLYRISVGSQVPDNYARIRVTVLPGVAPASGTILITARSTFDPEVNDSIELELPPSISMVIPDGPYLTGQELTFRAESDDTSIFIWTIEAGEPIRHKNISHIFERPGVYEVMVVGTISTSEGSLEGFAMTTVLIGNRPPEIASMSDESGFAGLYHALDAAQAASDEDGKIMSYRWTVSLDGNTTDLEGERVYHLFSEEGNYSITLTVTDDSGATADSSFVYSILVEDDGGDDKPVSKEGEDDEMLVYSLGGIIAGIVALGGFVALLTMKARRTPGTDLPSGAGDTSLKGKKPVTPESGGETIGDTSMGEMKSVHTEDNADIPDEPPSEDPRTPSEDPMPRSEGSMPPPEDPMPRSEESMTPPEDPKMMEQVTPVIREVKQ